MNVDFQFWTIDELQKRLGGRSRSSIYADVSRGFLPAPLRLGAAIRWRSDEVMRHLAELAERQRSEVRPPRKSRRRTIAGQDAA